MSEDVKRCCCGKRSVSKEGFITNGIIHEQLGVDGAFCGPIDKHVIRNLEAKVEALEQENFKLGAGLCIISGGLIGDDHGHPVCNILQELENEVCLNNGLKIQNKEQAERINEVRYILKNGLYDEIAKKGMAKPESLKIKEALNLLDKG